jgi:hypothetical protein
MRPITKYQLTQIGVKLDLPEKRIGIRAFGEVVPDAVITQLLGRFDFDGHAAIIHV